MARLKARTSPSRRRFGFAQRLLRMSGWGMMFALAACGQAEPTRIDGSSAEAFAGAVPLGRKEP